MAEQDDRLPVRVAAGIIFNNCGEFLLSSRPEGKPYAGYWEFAGGKVEEGETEFEALRRELEEELGIVIRRARPWLVKIHSYEHALVRLSFMRVEAQDWSGELQAKEGQSWAWQKTGDLTVSPMLPANGPLLEALSVPRSLTCRAGGVLEGENAAGVYRVVPFEQAEPPHQQVWIDETDLRHRGRMPEARSVWVRIRTAAQWPRVQDADVVLWQVENGNAAQEACCVLSDGVSVPLVIAAGAKLTGQYRSLWLDKGAHAVAVYDETEAV